MNARVDVAGAAGRVGLVLHEAAVPRTPGRARVAVARAAADGGGLPLPAAEDDRALARMLGLALLFGFGMAAALAWGIWSLLASLFL